MNRVIFGFVMGFLCAVPILNGFGPKGPGSPDGLEDPGIGAKEKLRYKHIMVFSFLNRGEAWRAVNWLYEKGYPGEIYQHSNGYYAVTIGSF